MRLKRIQEALKSFDLNYSFTEVDGCGSIDFDYREISYHIWEFEDDVWGAETNVRHGGYFEDIVGDYEDEIIKIIENWER